MDTLRSPPQLLEAIAAQIEHLVIRRSKATANARLRLRHRLRAVFCNTVEMT